MTQKNVKLTDLSGNILIPYTGIEVPTKTSQLTNDSGFLTTHQTIKQNGVTGATSNRYCTCTVAAATAAKTASITSGTFTLEAGAHVIVKFSNANTASNPTLNINGTGAKNIFHNGARITTDTNKALLAGAVEFVYDGTQWQLLGNYLNTITSDTKNTTGATDTSSKIFLVGATAQEANPQTYSHDTVYVDAGGCLNTTTPGATDNSTKAATTAWVVNKGYLTQANVTSTYSATGTAPVNGTAVKAAIDTALTSAYKPSGSIAFASLPELSASVMGNVYNITDSFTITSDFVEYESGKTKTFPAGSEVGVVNIGTTASPVYKFSVMSGFIDLSGYQQKDTAVTHTASTKVGDTNKPVYIAADGKATAISYTIAKSVPSDAKFTDTTYSVFTGATSSAAGSSGLVKAPAAGDQAKFLKGDGTWGTPSDTDTKNTTGSGDSNSKIFLVGATSQTASSVTYSHDTVFVDTNGRVNSAAPAADANDTTVATTAWVKGLGYKTTDNDTKNTAGSTNTSSKIFLIGATSQATNPQTYSHDTVFVDTSGQLNSANPAAATSSTVVATTKWVKDQGYLTTALQAGDDISNLVNDAGYLTVVDWSEVQNKPSSFTPSAHNQASNTINAMTGYSKASSAGAIAATDSLNTAIGKLEKALDGIPAAVTESTVSGWGFTKNAGTITGIKMNGASKGTSGVVDLGTVLTAHQTVKVNGVTGATTNNFGTCSTAAGTAAKTVTLTAGTFALETGARVLVKFTVTNTAASPTLNVGGTGAKAIQYRGSAITAGYLAANRTYEFVYDGTNYQLVGDINTDTNNATAQNISTADNTYPILLGNTANATANIGNKAALFGSGIKANPSTSTIVATTFQGNATSATTASKLGTADKGSATQPIYLVAGVPTACTYTLAKSVPSDAKFTDTVYTHPTTSGNKHIPSGGSANQVLVYSADGTAVWGSVPTHTHSDYVPTTRTVNGKALSADISLTASDVGALSSHQTIKNHGVTGATINTYASCSTAADTAAKTANITSGTFALEAGSRVFVKFANANTAGTPTLNINSKGAKNIFNNGAQITTGGNKALLKGVCEFLYDGTQWHLLGNYIDTIYTHPTTSGNKHIPSGGSSGQILKYSADGTAVWANEYSYTHPTTSGNKHIPSGGSSGQILKWSADGTATWAADNDTKNTAGSTDTSSKIFLIGATSQAANPQTYSHDTVFIDTAGALNTVTAAKGNSTTKAATTAFVATAISDYTKTSDLETMVSGVITQLNNAT